MGTIQSDPSSKSKLFEDKAKNDDYHSTYARGQLMMDSEFRPGGERYRDEMAYIRAAIALRPGLDVLAVERGGGNSVQP
ncbi:unnamed protein product [Tilletia controversa]|uniref:Uncharacterized protein n=3 Tax=Tilletia TaxID=13289 RepID=A0A8X7MWV0_9BASI|nr:hypothetical protein CF336_g2430 [Tilletia laevis]KAE8202066.1 hypothetical protein CF328_g2426 [Tilletia controversa]KAE8262931.1 hypothetical protein A4X03_0g2063 [Tilletia caries]KAE8206524.1 hypothetical protein CF335_g1821 [Tilletia laevis]KAE8250937.1 hypothetical protein A4X06_0g2877 [Tilletia controversa]